MGRYRAAYRDPDGERYGIPTFTWRSAPTGYATVRQLRALGLRPGGQPVAAQVMWRGIGGTRVAYLYLVALAKPKREASPAQFAAIVKALLARRTCSAHLLDLRLGSQLLHPAFARRVPELRDVHPRA
jgi:hypothetical protein